MSAALQLVNEPDTSDLQAEGSALVVRAQAITITDDETFSAAVAFMNDCVARRKVIVEKFREPKQKANDAHRSICALERELLDVVDKAEREAKNRIATYRADQERIVAQERRRLEEIARKQEEERLLADALDAQSAGDSALADEILAEPIAPPPVRVAPPTPKVAGVQFREEWDFELVSIVEVAKHVAAHPEDACLLALNTTATRQMVRARKSAFRINGIRAFLKQTVAAGGGRR